MDKFAACLVQTWNNMGKKASQIIKYAVSAALAAVLLYFSFRDVEWADFVEGVKACRWEFIVLSMVSGSFAFWLRAVRWRQLLLPIDDSITRVTAFNGVNIGNITNIKACFFQLENQVISTLEYVQVGCTNFCLTRRVVIQYD